MIVGRGAYVKFLSFCSAFCYSYVDIFWTDQTVTVTWCVRWRCTSCNCGYIDGCLSRGIWNSTPVRLTIIFTCRSTILSVVSRSLSLLTAPLKWLRTNLNQVVCTYVPRSPSSMIWHWTTGTDSRNFHLARVWRLTTDVPHWGPGLKPQ